MRNVSGDKQSLELSSDSYVPVLIHCHALSITSEQHDVRLVFVLRASGASHTGHIMAY